MTNRRRLITLIVAIAAVAALDCRNAENTQVQNQGAGGGGGDAEREPGTIPDSNMPRSEIPAEFQWDLSPILENDAAFEAGLTETGERRQRLEACRGHFAEAARMQECFALYFETRLLTNRLTLYAQMQQSIDNSSAEIEGRVDRSQRAMTELMGLAAVMRTEVLAMDETALNEAFEGNEELGRYRFYVDQMRRRREHVLGDEAERILTQAGDNLWAEIDLNEIPSEHERAFGALMSELPLPEITDETGETVQLAFSNYGRYRGSSDRRVRRDTVEGFFATLRAFDSTFASLLGGQARYSVFLARSRGYDTALDAYLWKDNVDPDIYRNLVAAIEANVEPLHRYMRLRQRQMGVEDLHIYDLYVPLVPAVERRIPFEEASASIIAAMEPLGEEYLTVLRQGLDPANGWIDVYPHENKRSGAFSANVYGVHPYVFMNYFEDHNSMSTLAHEYGHAIHSHYSMENQPYVSYAYVPMIAETASTFNEVLLSRHLIAEASNDDERLYLLGELVETIRGTIYRQALFAAFELALHTAAEEGTPITAEFLDNTYTGLLRRYYGDALAIGENDGMEWAYVPHFYYKYYVYSYAAGLSAGIALGDRVLNGGEAERDAYLNMLRAGGSQPPLELFRGAGVDPSNPEVVEAAARLMDESLSQMEEILDRREGGS